MQEVPLSLKIVMVIFESVILGITFYDKQNCEKIEHIS